MRKTPFIRFVSLLMAVLLLVSSTGFIVVEHDCLMRGKTQTAWTGEESCNPGCGAPARTATQAGKKSAQVSKVPCCQETTLLSRADITAVEFAFGKPLTQYAAVSLPPPSLSFPVRYNSALESFHSQRPDPGPLVLTVSRYMALLCIWLL